MLVLVISFKNANRFFMSTQTQTVNFSCSCTIFPGVTTSYHYHLCDFIMSKGLVMSKVRSVVYLHLVEIRITVLGGKKLKYRAIMKNSTLIWINEPRVQFAL